MFRKAVAAVLVTVLLAATADLSGAAAETAAGGIVLVETTADCGIARQPAPKKNDAGDVEKMEPGVDYFDWPFDVFCGDLDGDGNTDIVSSDHHASHKNRTPGGVWLGNGDGTFGPNILLASPDEGLTPEAAGRGVGGGYGTVLDIDGDGRTDFICSEGGGCYRNDGVSGEGAARVVRFTRIPFGGARGWIFGDFNRDGNLDLATGWGSTLHFGKGKGTFPSDGWTESAQAKAEFDKWVDPLHSCVGADLRRSGSMDIVAGQSIWRWAWGGPKREDAKDPRGLYFVNDGKGNLTESAEAFGLAEMSSTGPIVAADFDRDGYFDVFAVGLGNGEKPATATLYTNKGGKKFSMASAADHGIMIAPSVTGIPLQYCCASAADLDNDGWLDLVVGEGKGLRVFRNLGGLKFREIDDFSCGGDGRVVRPAVADFNNDGLPDVALNGGGPIGLHVFMNRTATDSGWLDVAVRGKEGNSCAIGALVEVFAPGKLGDRAAYIGMQHVVAENMNRVPLAPHFGLGAAGSADVRVTLPTGEVRDLSGAKSKSRVTVDFSRE